jgi:hypothetical protein
MPLSIQKLEILRNGDFLRPAVICGTLFKISGSGRKCAGYEDQGYCVRGENQLFLRGVPPKKESEFAPIESAVREIALLRPDFMSVTCGAGGSAGGTTGAVASLIKTGAA